MSLNIPAIFDVSSFPPPHRVTVFGDSGSGQPWYLVIASWDGSASGGVNLVGTDCDDPFPVVEANTWLQTNGYTRITRWSSSPDGSSRPKSASEIGSGEYAYALIID